GRKLVRVLQFLELPGVGEPLQVAEEDLPEVSREVTLVLVLDELLDGVLARSSALLQRHDRLRDHLGSKPNTTQRPDIETRFKRESPVEIGKRVPSKSYISVGRVGGLFSRASGLLRGLGLPGGLGLPLLGRLGGTFRGGARVVLHRGVGGGGISHGLLGGSSGGLILRHYKDYIPGPRWQRGERSGADSNGGGATTGRERSGDAFKYKAEVRRMNADWSTATSLGSILRMASNVGLRMYRYRRLGKGVKPQRPAQVFGMEREVLRVAPGCASSLTSDGNIFGSAPWISTIIRPACGSRP
ncbi:hypothetical protein GW17_00041398, partial [Ensete ventricosum]